MRHFNVSQNGIIISDMRNLIEIYNEVYLDTSKWRYYSKMNINPFKSDNDTRNFIASFIEFSGKAQQNPLYDNVGKLDKQRIRHIVSTFFLGTYLYYKIPKIKGSIDVVINRFKIQNPNSKIEFSFIWFLICLFHDLGYSIENHKYYRDFDNFINGKVKYFLNKRVGVPALYGNVYKNYFNYRLNSEKEFLRKPDHGICGGIILFNKLNNILLKKQENKKSEGLSWNKKLINIYRYSSWVILSHNIFFIPKGHEDEKNYRENNLEELILDQNEVSKVKLAKHSFLYLFCLVDTLDPIKTFESFENLKKVKFCFIENKIILEVHDDSLRENYFKKVNTLKEWLIPEIEIIKNRLEIKI